ncbi:MAG: hypothetical protein M3340_08530, partial [Actinomycetota bacterium]|nr:hypothetical protein [Actinomycetota bacterium]
MYAPPHPRRAVLLATVLAALVAAGPASANHGATALISGGADADATTENFAAFCGASSDGSVVPFVTSDRLLPEDTDSYGDVYQRTPSGLSLVSQGPNGFNRDVIGAGRHVVFARCGDFQYSKHESPDVAEDGTRVIFQTNDQLVDEDDDAQYDLYERVGGTTTNLLSKGEDPARFNGDHEPALIGTSPDGSRVFFETAEQILESDMDSAKDVYVRENGVTQRVSPGNGPHDATRAAVHPHGAGTGAGPYPAAQRGDRIFFSTTEQLAAGDGDAARDIYEWDEGQVRLVSTGPAAGSEDEAYFAWATRDQRTVVFMTAERLVSADVDGSYDVYARVDGQTTELLSGGDGNYGTWPRGLAEDADGDPIVFFETEESLVAADGDQHTDVYRSQDGQTTLMTPSVPGLDPGFVDREALFAGAAADGSPIVVWTVESLNSADTDSNGDLYTVAPDGTAALVTDGHPTGPPPRLEAVAPDGSRIFFSDWVQVTPDDQNPFYDVYELHEGTVSRVSTGPADGPLAPGDQPDPNGTMSFLWTSADGARVLFGTGRALVDCDTDGREDIFMRFVGAQEDCDAGEPPPGEPPPGPPPGP